MSDDQLLPCDDCRTPIPAAARVCAHCRREATVDVVPRAYVADGRLRYKLARELAALPGMPAFPPLQAALAANGPIVAGVTRAQGLQVIDVLAAAGVSAEMRRHAAPATARGGGPRSMTVAVSVAAAVLVLLATVGLVRSRRAPQGVAAPAPAAEPAAQRTSATAPAPRAAVVDTRELSRRSLPGTVSLRCGQSMGSGFYVAPELVLTNAHVLCGIGTPLTVTHADGREATGQPLRAEEDVDLALVRVPGSTAPALPLGDAGSLAVGDRVLLVGSPVGMEFTVHEGMVSHLGRSVLGIAYVQIDAKVNPGNSGGPLIDTQGRVVGVVSLKRTDAEGIGLALPINYAYPDQKNLVTPATLPDPAAFQAMVAAGHGSEERVVAEVREAISQVRPFLASVQVAQSQLVIRVAQPARSVPGTSSYTLEFIEDDRPPCQIQVTVTDWREAQRQGPAPAIDPRLKGWIEKNGLDLHLFLGETSMSRVPCGRNIGAGVRLNLVGGDPDAPTLVSR